MIDAILKTTRRPGTVVSWSDGDGGRVTLFDRENGADWIALPERWVVIRQPPNPDAFEKMIGVEDEEEAYDLMRKARGGEVDWSGL